MHVALIFFLQGRSKSSLEINIWSSVTILLYLCLSRCNFFYESYFFKMAILFYTNIRSSWYIVLFLLELGSYRASFLMPSLIMLIVTFHKCTKINKWKDISPTSFNRDLLQQFLIYICINSKRSRSTFFFPLNLCNFYYMLSLLIYMDENYCNIIVSY